ncbi:MAG TPA: alpha/beta hydrolase [Gaiellaceae bacterium]|nr:alpha/beta hydrolase [Gaiellaceae bacterium]
MLHGLTCNAAYWLRVTPLLEGRRSIALDFGGHGLRDHRDSYRYADYERDLLWLMDQLGLQHVTVAGHSLGGYVALLASTRSDRISGVLAVDVKSDWTDADAELAERSRSAAQRLEPDRAALVERLQRSVRPAVLAAEELELVAARSIEQVGHEWRFRWDRRVLATEPVDPYAFLSDVRCDTRIMSGSESDVMPPDSATRFAAAIPGAVLEVVNGVGHHVELEAAERVARRIRELSEGS